MKIIIVQFAFLMSAFVAASGSHGEERFSYNASNGDFVSLERSDEGLLAGDYFKNLGQNQYVQYPLTGEQRKKGEMAIAIELPEGIREFVFEAEYKKNTEWHLVSDPFGVRDLNLGTTWAGVTNRDDPLATAVFNEWSRFGGQFEIPDISFGMSAYLQNKYQHLNFNETFGLLMDRHSAAIWEAASEGASGSEASLLTLPKSGYGDAAIAVLDA